MRYPVTLSPDTRIRVSTSRSACSLSTNHHMNTMPGLHSASDDFELVEAIHPLPLSSSSTNGKFKPGYWHPYPFQKDEDLAERPWVRPEQIQTSFVGVNVIDVESSRVMHNMTVKISKGYIRSIERMKPVDMQDDGWISVDCKGLYMCPGLIDCESDASHRQLILGHTHIVEDVRCYQETTRVLRPLICRWTTIMEKITRPHGC